MSLAHCQLESTDPTTQSCCEIGAGCFDCSTLARKLVYFHRHPSFSDKCGLRVSDRVSLQGFRAPMAQ